LRSGFAWAWQPWFWHASALQAYLLPEDIGNLQSLLVGVEVAKNFDNLLRHGGQVSLLPNEGITQRVAECFSCVDIPDQRLIAVGHSADGSCSVHTDDIRNLAIACQILSCRVN